MKIIDILGPVVLIVLLGAVLRARRVVPPRVFKHMNALTYRIGLPAMLFVKTASLSAELGSALRVFYVLAGAATIATALGYLLGGAMRLRAPSLAAFVQCSYRGNLAFVGLSVLLYAADSSPAGQRLETLALLTLGPTVPLYNVYAVLVLSGSASAGVRPSARALLLRVLSNPLLLACGLGLTVAALPLEFPQMLLRTGSALGQMALPLALLGIGAGIDLQALRRTAVLPALAASLKLLIGPAIGFGIATVIGLSAEQLQVAMVYLVTPTAAASFVMAEQMGADATLTSNTIALTTLLSAGTLSAVLALWF